MAEQIEMRYTYTAAWAVSGGLTLRQEDGDAQLVISESDRFLLTLDPDPHLVNADKGSAIARRMLKGFVGQGGEAGTLPALSSEIDEIKTQRKKKAGARTILVFQGHGSIVATFDDSPRELYEDLIVFDAIDKRAVRERHLAAIEAMKAAVAIESDSPARFVDLTEATVLHHPSGKLLHSIHFSMSAEATVATPLSQDAASRISARYSNFKQATELGSVGRLFAQMSDDASDRLKAFLSGWAALEILIAKCFNTYEKAFLSPFITNESSTLRERFLDRVREVMKGKYRLTDKFIAVTAVLFPQSSSTDVENDYKEFCELKALRDSILHGDQFSEKELPVHRVAALLRKYVRVASDNASLNKGA